MKYSILVTLALRAGSSISASVPLRWVVTDFSVKSSNGGPTIYKAELDAEGEKVHCSASTDVRSSQCPGAKAPHPFKKTTCGKSDFKWELFETDSPVQNGGKIYYLEFFFDKPGSQKLYGCSSAFQANKTVCTHHHGKEGETLEAPAKFTITPTSKSQCLFI